MDAAERFEILNRYVDHARRFEEIAARRPALDDGVGAAVVSVERGGERRRELTKRELEVLQLIAEGLTSREIGKRLYLSEETVRTHVRSLLAALQVHSRARAVAVGFRRGVIR
jgi:DNA-binding NarL/FixJ family response regulator